MPANLDPDAALMLRVKQIAGARRWSARCQTLYEQIVDFLRHCLTIESNRKHCALLVY